MSGWEVSDVRPDGNSFGDGQVGDEISRTYTKPHPTLPGHTLRVTEAYAVVDVRERYGIEDDERPYAWDMRTEFLHLDAEGVEVYCDYEYESGSWRSYETSEEALASLYEEAQDHSEFIDWEGE